jgi:hypothetical protein
MGRMFHRSDFSADGLKPEYYFPDAYWDSRGGAAGLWKFTVASGYPFALHVHNDMLSSRSAQASAGALRVEIRKFIERHLEGDVVITRLDKTYFYRPEPNKYDRYPSRREVAHGYLGFNFEFEADAVHFKLRFSDIVSEVQDRHPSYDWVTEDMIGR